MGFESQNRSTGSAPEETIDQGRRDFIIKSTAVAGAAATGMLPDNAEAFGSSVSPEDFKKEYLDNLDIPLHLGNPATIKKQLSETYRELSPMQRSMYIMAMPSNCSGKTILKSYNPSNGSIEVVCKSQR